MSVFTPAEIEYLSGHTLARLATVGPDGRPHIVPITFLYNPDEDAIDIGGIGFDQSKKWRDALGNTNVTFLLDDVPEPGKARALEVRGDAETHTTGGGRINPRFPNFVDAFIRIRPVRIVAWGLDDVATTEGFRPNARTVA